MDMKTYQEKLKIKHAYEVYKEATEEIRNRVLELAANLPLRR